MTRPFDPKDLQFFLTVPSPCPYLPDRYERKIFTQLDPLSGPHLNDYLTHSGFRRSQNVIYRPACEACRECRSLRLRVTNFKPNANMRRVINRNQYITREVCEPYATREQFSLLSQYLITRHPDGGMASMTFERYETMVEECASRTEIVEYRNPEGELVATALTDVLSDGLSMVYSFFDPDLSKQSLGTYMVLDHAQLCDQNAFPFLYLGYWVKDSPKMAYKARFQPAEILGSRGWLPMENLESKS